MIAFAAIALIIVVGTGSIVLTLRVSKAAGDDGDAMAPMSSTIDPGPTDPGPTDLARRAPENSVERLVVWLKHRKRARIALSALSFALLAGAAGVIGYPFYTNLYQDRLQSQLDRQLASPELRDAYLGRNVAEGDSLTRIQIPSIGVDTIVVEGTSASALRAGAGHYPSTPLPCEIGNVGIAGHRTTYGRPFHDLDLLGPGDEIILETPIGRCTYEIRTEYVIVPPTQTSVVDNTPDEARLTLTTCHPKGSARQRLVVTATMVGAESFDG